MHNNKFGMFIHWGIYAIPAVQEQVFARMDWPREQYEGLMHQFDPVKYDPEKWVLLAKEAGMQYICFTTKHHDGFCMWDTQYTDYKVTNTPYGKDVLKMLADACQKHGMLLSLYYSVPDWHHPNGYNPASTHQWKAVRGNGVDMETYGTYIKNQVRELLLNYGPIYTFFWDIPPRIKDASMNELVRSLQPGILINDRGFDQGDFSTPERDYQKNGQQNFERMTEACNSLGEQSWGYRSNEDFYSLRHVISSIDSVMSRGGSYLLNVGPTALGEIAPEYAERLKRVGDWYNRMEGCLEGAQADDFDFALRETGCVATRKNGKSYLHFAKGLRSSALAMERFPAIPKQVRLMNTGQTLQAEVARLPEYFTAEGRAMEFLHIRGIPVDDLASEAIVLEIEW